MDYTKIDRPLEPYSCDEDAEQWVAVLAWEESRADALQAEVERLRGALTEIHQNGGFCTDEDGCPICIAEKALAHKQGEQNG